MFDQFADELLAERNARPLVIVGTSKVDDLLFAILSTYFLPKFAGSNDRDELLEGDRPLAMFSARIKLCRRLALIDETHYRTLEILRDLRNKSAHSIAFDVTKSPVRDYISELRKRITGRNSFRLTRERYFDNTFQQPIEELQCLLLTICVLLEAIREKTRVTRGNASVLRIGRK